jgi:hypothetical protein
VTFAGDTTSEWFGGLSVASGGGEARWFDEKEARRAEQQQLGEKDQSLAPGKCAAATQLAIIARRMII